VISIEKKIVVKRHLEAKKLLPNEDFFSGEFGGNLGQRKRDYFYFCHSFFLELEFNVLLPTGCNSGS